MPIYSYKCPVHGEFEESFPLSENPQFSSCPECGRTAKKVIKSPAIHIFEPYYDVGLGEQIDSKEEREKIAKAKNATPIG